MTDTKSKAHDFDALRARAGIGPRENLTEQEFTARVHDHGFTPGELAAVRAGLTAAMTDDLVPSAVPPAGDSGIWAWCRPRRARCAMRALCCGWRCGLCLV
jgi:hypothetical protein